MSPSLSIIHIKLNTHIPACILGQVRQKFEKCQSLKKGVIEMNQKVISLPTLQPKTVYQISTLGYTPF